MKVLGTINSTEKNLKGSIEGETHEYTSMYPAFVREAEAERKSDAVLAFTYAMKAEEVHAGLYKKGPRCIRDGHMISAGKRSSSPGLRQHRDREGSRQVPDLRGIRKTVHRDYPLTFFIAVPAASAKYSGSVTPILWGGERYHGLLRRLWAHLIAPLQGRSASPRMLNKSQ